MVLSSLHRNLGDYEARISRLEDVDVYAIWVRRALPGTKAEYVVADGPEQLRTEEVEWGGHAPRLISLTPSIMHAVAAEMVDFQRRSGLLNDVGLQTALREIEVLREMHDRLDAARAENLADLRKLRR